MLPSDEFFAFPKIAHAPEREWWLCRACGSEWPCAPARAELEAAVTVDLPGHMAHLMQLAAHDLGLSNQPSKLYRRFLHWLTEGGKTQRCGRCGRVGHQALPGLPPRLFPCRFDNELPAVPGSANTRELWLDRDTQEPYPWPGNGGGDDR